MFYRRRLPAVLVLALALLAVAAAGVWYQQDRAHGASGLVLIEAAGLDLPPPAVSSAAELVAAPAARPEPTLEDLEQTRQALYEQWLSEAVAAYVALNRRDTAAAAEAIGRWGRGQLLLSIPRLGVSAAVTGMGRERDGTPATPNSPWGVAWYTFTSYPGTGGNAVFSGHVDWYTGAPAVFGRLRSVGAGDVIHVVLPDGTPIAYEVASSYYVDPNTANVGAIYGHAGREAITIITCGGTWNAALQDYSHRLIVRAYRVR